MADVASASVSLSHIKTHPSLQRAHIQPLWLPNFLTNLLTVLFMVTEEV